MSKERFLDQIISPWMRQSDSNCDVVLSTRVRLARNIKAQPFPNSELDTHQKVLNIIEVNFSDQLFPDLGSVELVKMNNLAPIDRHVLVEKHLISPNLAAHSEDRACLLSQSEELSIMVNEEDHLRIQCLLPGFQLEEALNLAMKADDWMENKITYAYDEKIGYLTSCPSNVGTGLRASVMMHLPALTLSGKLDQITENISKIGLVVRGIYGEGSKSFGNLYQLSNQITLGKSETAITNDLKEVVEQIIALEQETRKSFLQVARISIEDRVFRSLGILKNARLITSNEAAQRLSEVRVGIDLGIISGLNGNIFNELMIAIQPGCLQRYAGKELSPEERDFYRASLIRDTIA